MPNSPKATAVESEGNPAQAEDVEALLDLWAWIARRRVALRDHVEHLDRMIASAPPMRHVRHEVVAGELRTAELRPEPTRLQRDRYRAATDRDAFEAELERLADPSKPHRQPFELRVRFGSENGLDHLPGEWRRDVGTALAVDKLVAGCREAAGGVPSRAVLSAAARDLAMALEGKGERGGWRAVAAAVEQRLAGELAPERRKAVLAAQQQHSVARTGGRPRTGILWEVRAVVGEVLGVKASAVQKAEYRVSPQGNST